MERSSEHPRPELDRLSIVMVAETLPPAPHPIGGAGKLLVMISRAAAELGARVRVAVDAFVRDAPAGERWVRDGLEVLQVPMARSIPTATRLFGRAYRRKIVAERALPEIARRLSPDLLHLHIHPNGLFRFAAGVKRKTGATVVVTTHGLDLVVHRSRTYRDVPFGRDWIPSVESIDYWIPCGPLDHEGLVAWGVPEARIVPIYNGVPIPESLPERTVCGPERAPISMAYAGRLLEKKGVVEMAEGAVRAARELGALQLRIAGACDGALREKLERILRSGAPALDYTFLGEIDSAGVEKLMRAVDIFCHPSNCPEGLPLSVLEAAAQGCPLIVSDIPAHLAVLEAEKHAIVFNAGSAEAIAQAIVRAARDPELRERMRREAYELAARRYNLELMVASYLDFYARVARERAGTTESGGPAGSTTKGARGLVNHYAGEEIATKYDSRHLRNPLERYQAAHLGPLVRRMIRQVTAGARTVCDLGIGSGIYLTEIDGKIERIVGVDLSPEMLAAARGRLRGVELVEGDATKTGLPSDAFDAVISIGLMEYVSAPALVAEAYRLLRPGGRFLMQTPNRHGGEKAIYLFIKHRLKRRPRVQCYLTRGEVARELRRGGFVVEQLVMNDGIVWLPPSLMPKIGEPVYRAVEAFWRPFGRNPFAQNMVFLCRKPER